MARFFSILLSRILADFQKYTLLICNGLTLCNILRRQHIISHYRVHKQECILLAEGGQKNKDMTNLVGASQIPTVNTIECGIVC